MHYEVSTAKPEKARKAWELYEGGMKGMCEGRGCGKDFHSGVSLVMVKGVLGGMAGVYERFLRTYDEGARWVWKCIDSGFVGYI